MTSSVTLLITSGGGPGECQQAAAHVLRRMLGDAEEYGVDVDVSKTPTKHGVKSAIIVIHGDAAPLLASRWRGTIQWSAQSGLRPHHKRRNWFIGVLDCPFQPRNTAPLRDSDLHIDSFRAGGPGGQHQNTTDSAVRATHVPSGLVVVVRDGRSQHRNRALARERMATLLDLMETDARARTDQERYQLHMTVKRGAPVRRFKGPSFREVI